MSIPLTVVPVHFREACAFISLHHRHHRPPQGYKFAVAVRSAAEVVGVAMTGRPVSRILDDNYTLEVTRLCTLCTAANKNACSMLYSACRKAARALGYRQLITYILATESGTSLRAAGWDCLGSAGGGSWNCPSRPRTTDAPTISKIKYAVRF